MGEVEDCYRPDGHISGRILTAEISMWMYN